MIGSLEEITKTKLVLGEGKEEVLFFNALLEHLQITDIQVEPYGGKDKLHDALKAFPKRPDFSSIVTLAITRDADFNESSEPAKDAFQSVCAGLEKAKLAVPSEMLEKAGGPPDICIFILPDCQNPGMLENLCLASLGKSNPSQSEINCIETYFNCIATASGRKQQVHREPKAYLQAWLATQFESDKKLGEAARLSYFDWESPAFDKLKHFLRSL